MGSCFKFGKNKKTYRFTDPYSKATSDGKYQLQGNYDFSTENYVAPAGVPTDTEASQRKELKATTVTEENGVVSPPMQNSEVTTTTTTTTTTVTTGYTKTEDEPRVNGDIAGDVAATAAAAVVVAGTIDAVKSGDDENKLDAEELARDTDGGKLERTENTYTYETPGDEDSQSEPQTTEEDYETIPDSSPLSETTYQAEAYEVAVMSNSSERTTVVLGQEDDDVVDVSESAAYYSAPAGEEDYYSTVAEPTDDDDDAAAGVIVTTQSVIVESQPAFDEQHSYTGVSVSNRNSDELQSREGEPGMEDTTEESSYSVVKKTTVITTNSTEEESTANTTSRLSNDYDNEPGSYTSTVTTTETTYYNVEPSQINDDSTGQLSENSADDSQRTSVTVNYTTDASDLHPQLTTTNSLECQTPTSGQFARNVDDYILS